MRLIAISSFVALLAVVSIPILAEFECPPDLVPLAEATRVSGAGEECYRFEIPGVSPFVRFDVDAAGALDLYFSEGLHQSLSDWDRVNVGPIEGDVKFVLIEPSPGAYTLAVAPESSSGGYRLAATAGTVSGDEEPLTTCYDGVCSTAMPLKHGPQAIELGAKFGDRVIFPLTVAGPGKLEVTVHWSGTAERLALILNGPRRPELANPVAYYARKDGGSPLTLTYTVLPEDLERGRRFQVSLVNFSGGEAFGGIDIEAPEKFMFNYVALATGPLVAQVVDTTIPVAKSQEEICQDAVQGKVAWNYQGSTRWSPANVKRLCKGTKKGSEPAGCFRQVMHGDVDWGGGTRWQWENAIDLCEGTSNARRTVYCFKAAIDDGMAWSEAIRTCETR